MSDQEGHNDQLFGVEVPMDLGLHQPGHPLQRVVKV
jgi:hypothetical protein